MKNNLCEGKQPHNIGQQSELRIPAFKSKEVVECAGMHSTFQWSFVLCCFSCSAFRIIVPRPGIIRPTALQWKRKVLTSGPPGKPLSGHRLCLASLHLSVCLSFVGKHRAPSVSAQSHLLIQSPQNYVSKIRMTQQMPASLSFSQNMSYFPQLIS